MLLFMTSSPCDDHVPEGHDLPCILNEVNWFVDNLRESWKPYSKVLIIAADPDNFELNDEMRETFYKAFQYHGLTMEEFVLCDERNGHAVGELVAESDMIILGGGHVPTAHAFWSKIGLREALYNFDGIVMGISAGSMLCAEVVYAQPEEGGESIDPDYERFIDGLGLSCINTLPHYQEVRDKILDGKRLYEDITFEDSYDHEFFVLVDGSYIMEDDNEAMLFGEAYLVKDGEIEKICEEGECIKIF